MPKKIAKSAKDGKIVSKKFAAENPDTTFETEVDPETEIQTFPPEAEADLIPDMIEDEATEWVPAVGEKFLLVVFPNVPSEQSDGTVGFPRVAPDFVASISADGVITIHEIVGGCQSERVFDVSSAAKFSMHPMDQTEAFWRLSGN